MPREDQDHRFMTRFGELKAFIEQNGRRPRAESKDAVEAGLGTVDYFAADAKERR